MKKKKREYPRSKHQHQLERLEEQELQKLEQLKKEASRETKRHPLTRITRADVVRSVIGALVGTVGHFAFFYGAELAEKISVVRATILYGLSLVICFFFMYYSGFRKVKEVRIFRFIPLRITVVYLVSILVVFGTLFLFGIIDTTTSFLEAYRIIATTLLLAVLGASAADMLGRD